MRSTSFARPPAGAAGTVERADRLREDPIRRGDGHELGRDLITVAGHEDMTRPIWSAGSCSKAARRSGSTAP